jgi:hypothetical protein
MVHVPESDMRAEGILEKQVPGYTAEGRYEILLQHGNGKAVPADRGQTLQGPVFINMLPVGCRKTIANAKPGITGIVLCKNFSGKQQNQYQQGMLHVVRYF